MPTFAELLSYFSFVATNTAAFGALIAAGLIVIFFDWRFLVFAFGILAVFTGLLYAQLLPPQIAGIKMMIGLLIAVQMWVTGRQIAANRAHDVEPLPAEVSDDEAPVVRRRITTGLPFRIVVAVMIFLVSWQVSASPNFTVPDVPPIVSLAVIGLVAMGLLGLGLTEDPLKAGMLLLVVLTGFELYYAAIEPALAVIALLAAMNFAIALAAGYLAIIKSIPARSQAQ
jgi:hypothetical protein